MTPKQVVKHYGNQTQAAKALGKTRAAISFWLKKNRIPYAVQCQIQLQTNGALKASL